MRLIDADLFKQQMSAMALTSPSFFTSKVVKLLEIIDKQPTAYDLEAVVRQLEKNHVAIIDDYTEEYEDVVFLEEAIDIVRKAGVK